jgi:hypothetical protein
MSVMVLTWLVRGAHVPAPAEDDVPADDSAGVENRLRWIDADHPAHARSWAIRRSLFAVA